MHRPAACVAAIFLLAGNAVWAQAFLQEEFSEDDFAQFFSLIVDGKISKDKMAERCADQQIGFTFAGRDVQHDGSMQRIFYNVSREDTSVDGRTLRAKHFNASFGEWAGSVFKALCPGMYSIAVDFSTSEIDGVDVADEVLVHVYLKRADMERPGQRVVTAVKSGSGPRGSGHATLALPLRSGDEISTYSEAVGPETARNLSSVSLTAYKVVHLEDYVSEVDMDAWTREIAAIKQDNP
jgi:hypothetical protein